VLRFHPHLVALPAEQHLGRSADDLKCHIRQLGDLPNMIQPPLLGVVNAASAVSARTLTCRARSSCAASSRYCLPRIDKWDTAVFETADIARDHAGAVGARDGCDHQIERRGWAAGLSARGGNVREGRCGRRVEREHAPVEIVCEYGSSRRFKSNAAAAFRYDGETCEDFRLTNRRGEQRLFRLAGGPCSHLRRRPGAHDRGQDVGVEDED
jgi:hypothetical protein